jgi:hypothetical protein
MKRLILTLFIATLSGLYASESTAGGRGWGHHGHHHHHGNHRHHQHFRGPGVRYYYPAPTVYYYPAPPVPYYPVPPVAYYSQPPAYAPGYYDRRSPQGLAGGVIGSMFGYQMGNGDPIATGIGAAAGSYLGNGIGYRY